MANKDYTTVEALKAARELSGTNFADGQIPGVITAASRVIDEMCGHLRRFWLDDDNTSIRYYTPSRTDTIEIDDIADIQQVATDLNGDGTFEQTWAATDYTADPLNAVADERPYERLIRTWNSTFYFPCRVKSVRITGQFGWSAVPADITLATEILAVRYLLRAREAPGGIITVGGPVEGSMMRLARTDPDLPGLLDRFSRKRPIL